MTWQILTIGLFAMWLSLGAAIGGWISPVRHDLDAGLFFIQSLYVAHESPPLRAANAEAARITLVTR